MVIKMINDIWNGSIFEMVIGIGPNTVKAGGDCALPFLRGEDAQPVKPVTALEVWDVEPREWSDVLTGAFPGVLHDPAAWAKKCAQYGADLISLKLAGTHPDLGDASPEQAAAIAKEVAAAVEIPLIVTGCGIEEKDTLTLPVVARALSGRNVLIGSATANNYKDIAAACIEYGHNIIANSPLDINLAKQLNILISEMNLPLHRIAMDPLVGSLGYGIEYAYSIMERSRLGALNGDKMLSMPIICFAGQEAWKTKEANSPENMEWGDLKRRAVLWEAITASTLAQAGGSIFVLRHPESLKQFKVHIESMTALNI
jgi:acetyl-CoA decarbonylase/synthase complex subunit delta